MMNMPQKSPIRSICDIYFYLMVYAGAEEARDRHKNTMKETK